MFSTSLSSQPHIPSGARVETPVGTGTLEGFADVLERGSTRIEFPDTALVLIPGKGRQTFNVTEIAREVSQQPVYEGTRYHGEWKGAL